MIIDKPFIHLFKTTIGYYIFDVNKNQIIKVNEKIYNILHEQLNSGNTKVAFDGNEESTKIISNLIKNGFLSSKKVLELVHPADELLEYRLNNKVQRIILQVTQNCNLRCGYCIYTSSDFGKQRKHSNKQMSIETALKGIDFALERSRDNRDFNVGFYGGEPILAFDMIKKCVEYTEKKAEGKKLSFTITTNGTLLNEEVIKFFEEHNISLTISLDGPKEIHDRNRRFASDGSGTFDIIMQNVEKLRAKFPEFFSKVMFNAVMDPETSYKCTNEFYLNYETIKGMSVSYSVAENQFEFNKTIPNKNFIIESDYEFFKVFLYKLGRIESKYISEIALNRFEDVVRMYTKLIPSNSLPEKMHHGGPCVPGELRLFMDIYGNFFPCERVSETSQATGIGNVESGFDMDKVRSILNIGKITEKSCKNCWAIKHCTLCVSRADNTIGLSAGVKLSHCREARTEIENTFKDYIALLENGYKFEA